MIPLIDADLLQRQLGTELWSDVSSVAETGSTNADLIAAAQSGAPGGKVRVADYQDSGRGRLDRAWVAPRRAMIAISVMLRPGVKDPNRWLWLPLLSGLAVASGLRVATGAQPKLKWPNDVLVDGKKICGILAERVDSPPVPAVVVGMGINTKMTTSNRPVETATSLAIAGLPYDLGQVVVEVLRSFQYWYQRWEAGVDLSQEYSQACSTIGREVNVIVSADEVFTGLATKVDSNGCLVVQRDGVDRAFSAGDVIHLR